MAAQQVTQRDAVVMNSTSQLELWSQRLEFWAQHVLIKSVLHYIRCPRLAFKSRDTRGRAVYLDWYGKECARVGPASDVQMPGVDCTLCYLVGS